MTGAHPRPTGPHGPTALARRARGLALAALVTLGAACQDPADPSTGAGMPAAGHGVGPTAAAVLDLGTLPGGTNSAATGLNDQGVVVGTSETAVPGVDHAFVWTAGGGMTDLGTLGGEVSAAAAINNSFEIVGTTSVAGAPFTQNVPFVWDPVHGMTALPGSGTAFDISDQHVVAGCATIDATGPQVVRWDLVGGAWAATGLGRAPGGTALACARSVDNAGRIVGIDQQSTGFFYLNGVYQALGPGRLAYGISPFNRHVAGEAGLGPVVWPAFNPNGQVPLGYLFAPGFGAALDVSSANQAVGVTAPPANTISSGRAFYWDCREGMVELPTLLADPNSSAEAFAINQLGQSAGVSTWLPALPDRHAVLWDNPVSPVSVIPLPYQPNCTVPPVVSYIPKRFINDGILSIPGLRDATRIDPSTITIGDGFGITTPIARRQKPPGPPTFQLTDLNGDGLLDLQVAFSKAQMIADGTLTPQSFQLVVSWVDPTGLPQTGKYPIRVQ